MHTSDSYLIYEMTKNKFFPLLTVLLYVPFLMGGIMTINPATEEEELVFVPAAKERNMGRKIHKKVLKHFDEPVDPLVQERVSRIGKKLALGTDRKDIVYRFTVLDHEKDDFYNAFAAPGGYIYIFTDMVEVLLAARANVNLKKESLKIDLLTQQEIRFMHVAGFFVLPGLLDLDFALVLNQIQTAGLFTSLDVVTSPGMENPDYLWPLLPFLNVFMCNLREAEILTGSDDPASASEALHGKGALGGSSCEAKRESEPRRDHAPNVQVSPMQRIGGDSYRCCGNRQGCVPLLQS